MGHRLWLNCDWLLVFQIWRQWRASWQSFLYIFVPLQNRITKITKMYENHLLWMINQSRLTCVNSGTEIPHSLQCKIFQYTFCWQYHMKVHDFFSLCKIHQPAWIQVDRRNVGAPEMGLFRPLYHKTEKTRSHVWYTALKTFLWVYNES